MAVTLDYAKGLRDCDWFGKQDPYVVIKCGGQQFRSRTATDGGKNPVWGETFRFNVINENTAEIRILDEDNLCRDDLIGECLVSFSKARESGKDDLQVPVISKKQKQRGFISVKIQFIPNRVLKPQLSASAAPTPAQKPAAGPQQSPMQQQQCQAPQQYMQQPMQQQPMYPMACMPMAYMPIASYPAPYAQQ
jgi:Ca2+-dependent lipid-binding protein